jgi:hypothetical protein
MQSLAEGSHRVGWEIAHATSPYRDGDVRYKEHYSMSDLRSARVSTATGLRDRLSGENAAEERAKHRARMTTRSSSLMTLELMGMTGEVRSVPQVLPPLPPLPSDGAAEEDNTAAGGDVPHGANEQPHPNVFVAWNTNEQSRSDELSDAEN